MPGGVDDDTVDVDLGRAITGQLVGFGEVAVEAVGRVGIEERVDVFDDDGLRVYAPGPDVYELRAVLGLEVLLGAGIVLPDDAVIRNADLGRGVPGEGAIGVLGGDVVVQGADVLLRGVGRDIVAVHHHVVRRVASVVVTIEDVAGPAAVIVDQVGVLPDHAQYVVVGARAVDHAAVHDLQANGDQTAAAHRPDEVGKRMPVDDAQSGDRAFADVFVDHVGLLHASLRTGVDAVLDLDDGGRA